MYNNMVIQPATNPTKTGYTFAGWYKADMTTTWDFANDVVVENGTIYAKWTINQYTLTFKSQDGMTDLVPGGVVLNYDTSVKEAYAALHAEPTKVATAEFTYTFVGWSTAINAEAADYLTVGTENTTVYAAFSKMINQYTVTFKSQDGTIDLGVSTVDYATTATAPTTAPTKDATAEFTYTFAGWSTAINAEVADDDLSNVIAHRTVYAAFSKTTREYTVTFNVDGGSVIDPQTIMYNNMVIQPATNPTKTGYTFAGWYKADMATTWDFATDVVLEDVTIYAKWNVLTGIADLKVSDLKIYPNPVTSVLNIENIEQTNAVSVEIFDLSGKLVLQVPATQVIEVSILPHGIYTVKAGEYTAKIMKK